MGGALPIPQPSPNHLLCASELSGSLSHIYDTCAHEPEHMRSGHTTLPDTSPQQYGIPGLHVILHVIHGFL